MTRADEYAAKHERAGRFLREKDLDGFLISRRDNFSWYTGGADMHIVATTETGIADLLVTAAGATVITTNIEASRLAAEELGDLPLAMRTYPWHTDRATALSRAIGHRRIASDTGALATPNLHPEWARLRFPLVAAEIDAYRRLGRSAALAVEAAARQVQPGQTEYEVAAQLMARLQRAGLEATVTLVAADERIARFRHPIPTDHRVRERVMLIACARQRGLIVALTRIVHFGGPPEDLQRLHEAVCRVDAAFIAATRTGADVADAWRTGLAAYAAAGCPEEWTLHHQGGPIGYDNREFLVTPDTRFAIAPGQAYAWNPSITGSKSEDTILIVEAGREIITATGDWPTVAVDAGGEAILRPAILGR